VYTRLRFDRAPAHSPRHHIEAQAGVHGDVGRLSAPNKFLACANGNIIHWAMLWVRMIAAAILQR
jgi:hypothetical protein